MSEFINTIDLLGDATVFKSIADRSVTEFKDNRVTSLITDAFHDCKNLRSIDLPEVLNAGGSAFSNCSSLVDVHLPKIKTLGNNAFSGCLGFEKAYFPTVTEAGEYAFLDCANLKIAELGHLTYTARFVFCNCNKLVAFITRYKPSAGINSEIFISAGNGATTPIAKGTGYIYVPRDQIDAYKSTTNWSQFAEQYRAVEDYTVDGTLWGDLDEAKILGE